MAKNRNPEVMDHLVSHPRQKVENFHGRNSPESHGQRDQGHPGQFGIPPPCANHRFAPAAHSGKCRANAFGTSTPFVPSGPGKSRSQVSLMARARKLLLKA